MDPVLEALEQYRSTATAHQKALDLAQLEKDCLSTIDAYEYVYEVTVQGSGQSFNQDFINFNMNPDYNLDFSLSTNTYVSICNFCF